MKITTAQQLKIKDLFNKMNSKSDFLDLLNYTKSLLYRKKTFLFTKKQLNFYINKNGLNNYKTFKIKKKSGKTRIIHSPKKGLKEFQKCLNIILSTIYQPHESANGFVSGKSIVDNAKNHTGKNYVYNIDLKDFFPSVDANRVWGRLKAKPFNLGTTNERIQIANMIKAICCTPMQVERLINNKWVIITTSVLPQGAATSPILTNAICERLDIQLTGLSKRFGLEYSRYADDITFSSMHKTYIPKKGKQEAIYQKESSFDKELRRIINTQNFNINEKKIRLQKRGYKQEVTGLIVNEKVNTPTYYIKELRQWIYFLESKDYDKACNLILKKYVKNKGTIHKNTPNILLLIEGKLLYLKMVKGDSNPAYLKLKSRFDTFVKTNFVKNNYIKKENQNITIVQENRQPYNRDLNWIIDILFKEGLDKAMKAYKPE